MVIRKSVLDAEMLSEEGFPDPKNPCEKIISTAFWDNMKDDYIIILLGDKLETEQITLEFEEDEIGTVKAQLETYPNESALLCRFVQYVKQRGIDMILGWNVEGFDMAYTVNRMDRLGVNYRKLSESYVSTYQNRKGYWKVNLKGRRILDLLRVYKKQNVKELRNHTLEYVAQKELGYGKLTHEESITEMYENNLRKFLRYNLKDVILCEHLDKKLSLADEFVTNSRIASCNLSDVFSESQIADSFILSHIEDDENVALFTQRESEGVGDFAGGYVWSKGGDLYGVKTDE